VTQIYRKTEGPADWRGLLADPDRQWRAGFSAMAAALGLPAAPDTAASRALPCGLALRLGWASGDPAFLTDRCGNA